MLLLRPLAQSLIAVAQGSLCSSIRTPATFSLPTSLISIQTRSIVIYRTPRPTETKRHRKSSFLKRVQSYRGRKTLMLRILRGDKVISV